MQRSTLGLLAALCASCANLSTLPDSREVLHTAEASMGTAEELDAVDSLRATAECQAPDGPYTTELNSARGGHLHFRELRDGAPLRVAVLAGDRAWELTEGGARPLDEREATRVAAHDFAMIALEFPRRFPEARVFGTEEFSQDACYVVDFSDRLGRPAKAYFHQGSGLLAGFVLRSLQGDGDVTLRIAAWQAIDGVRLPGMVVVSALDGEYVLFFREIVLNGADPALLEPPA